MNLQQTATAVTGKRREWRMEKWLGGFLMPNLFHNAIGYFLLALIGSLAAFTSASFGQGSAPSAPFAGWMKYYPYLSDTSKYRLPRTGGTTFNGRFLKYIATGPSLADTTGWASIDLTADVTGVLPTANGGTGSSMTNGQLLIGDGSGVPTAATLTAGTNVSITNGAGSITINSTGGGSGTTDSISVDTNGDGTIDNFLYSSAGAIAMLKKGSNITLTVSGDTVTIAGPAGSGTADSLAIDTDGNGTIDNYLYSTAGAMAMLKEGTGVTFTVATDTLTVATTLGTDITKAELNSDVPIWSGFYSTFAGGSIAPNNPVFFMPIGGIYTRTNIGANPDTLFVGVNFDNATIDTANDGTLRVKDLGITNGKLADGAVTTAKVTAGAIGSNEITNNSIVTGDILDGTITGTDIQDGSLGGGEIAEVTIAASKLVANTLTANEIGADAVDASELKAASKLMGKFYVSSTKGDSTVADSAAATKGFVKRGGDKLRYLSAVYAYSVNAMTDSIETAFPVRYGNVHYLYTDSSLMGSDTNRMDCHINVPADFDLDSVALAYITSSATSANSNIDSVEIWGPDYSNGTNASDSNWYQVNVDYVSTSLTRVAFAVDKNLSAGDNFVVRFKDVLNADESWIRIAWVKFVGRER